MRRRRARAGVEWVASIGASRRAPRRAARGARGGSGPARLAAEPRPRRRGMPASARGVRRRRVTGSACSLGTTGSPSACGRPSASVFIRCMSHVDFSPLPSVRISASRTRPERPAGPPLDREDDLVVAPLLELVAAVVPDRHRAGAVLALRDRALERAVLQRMVLGHHREVVAPGGRGHALRHGPADEHAVVLEAEVPVQARGVVLLDDEPGQLARHRGRAERVARHRLGRACPRCAWRCRCAGALRRTPARRRGSRAPPSGRRSSRPARAPPRSRGGAGRGHRAPPTCAAPRPSDAGGRAASTARSWSCSRCSGSSR